MAAGAEKAEEVLDLNDASDPLVSLAVALPDRMESKCGVDLLTRGLFDYDYSIFRHPSSRSFPGLGLAVSYGSVYLYLHLDLRLKDMKLAMVQPRLLAIGRILKLRGQ